MVRNFSKKKALSSAYNSKHSKLFNSRRVHYFNVLQA